MGLRAIRGLFKTAKRSGARPKTEARQSDQRVASVRFAPTVTVRSLSGRTDTTVKTSKPPESHSEGRVSTVKRPRAIVKGRIPSKAAHDFKIATRRVRNLETLTLNEEKALELLAALDKLKSTESHTSNSHCDAPSKKLEQISKRIESNPANVDQVSRSKKLPELDAADLALLDSISRIGAKMEVGATLVSEENIRNDANSADDIETCIAELEAFDTGLPQLSFDQALAELDKFNYQEAYADIEALERKLARYAALFHSSANPPQDGQSEVDAMTTADLALKASGKALGRLHHFDVTVPVDWAPKRGEQAADTEADVAAEADLALQRAESLFVVAAGGTASVDARRQVTRGSKQPGVIETHRFPQSCLAQLLRMDVPVDLDEQADWMSQVVRELEFTSSEKADRVLKEIERVLIDREFQNLEQSLNDELSAKDSYDELSELENAIRNIPDIDSGTDHGLDADHRKKVTEADLESMVDQLFEEGWDGRSVDLVPPKQTLDAPRGEYTNSKSSHAKVSRSSVLAAQLNDEPRDRQSKRNVEMARVRKGKSGGRKATDVHIRTPLTQSLVNMKKFKPKSEPTSVNSGNRLREIQARNRARRIGQDDASVEAWNV